MCRNLFFFVAIFLFFISCKKDYTSAEKNRIEVMNSSDVYKVHVPDSAFLFCLDTIKSNDQFRLFSEEYCKNGFGKQSYIYLSTYKVYIPVFVEHGCGTIGCYMMRNTLFINVNKDRQWLVNKELVDGFDQVKMDSVVYSYFKGLKDDDKTMKAMMKFDLKSIKNNIERDSLYVSLITSYYAFIKREKKADNKLLDSLMVEYPFRLFFSSYNFTPPPPPPPIIGTVVDEINLK
jgi:hypothetical protein